MKQQQQVARPKPIYNQNLKPKASLWFVSLKVLEATFCVDVKPKRSFIFFYILTMTNPGALLLDGRLTTDSASRLWTASKLKLLIGAVGSSWISPTFTYHHFVALVLSSNLWQQSTFQQMYILLPISKQSSVLLSCLAVLFRDMD